ncbi:MAG: DUF6745 domain-containing protein, partial [Lutibacter sp.]
LRANLGDNLGANLWANLGDNLWANLRDNLRANLWANLWANLRANLRDNLWANLGVNLRDNLGDNLGANLWASLGANLGVNLGDNLRANLRDNLRDNLEYHQISYWGNIGDYGWMAFYDFIEKIKYFDYNYCKFNNFKLLLQSGIYELITFKNIIFVCAMPIKVHQDSNMRLHNTAGASVIFKDGYKVYAIHGRILPSWIWEKQDEITKDKFLSEKNSEIRAGMYNVLGEKKIMQLLGAKEVDKQLIQHKNDDVEIVKLFKTKETFSEIGGKQLAWVKMVCPSTGTEYLIACSPEHTNAKTAIASLSIFDSKDYSFDFRT